VEKQTPRACLRTQQIAQTVLVNDIFADELCHILIQEGVAFIIFGLDRLTELVLGMSK
jgi:hypothetical protein